MDEHNKFSQSEERETPLNDVTNESSETSTVRKEQLSNGNEQQEDPNHKSVKRRKRKTGFLNMVAASVVGSALTLGAVTQIDYFQPDPVVQEVTKEASATNAKNVVSSDRDVADIIEASSEAIVGITNIGQQNDPFQQSKQEVEKGTGSGVIYEVTDDAAYIVTNHHVIDSANKVDVSLYNGDTVQAKLVGTDPLTDIAVIKIKGEFDVTPLQFGDSDAIRSGDQVMAIGNPLGLDLSRTVTQGIISAMDRSIHVQTSAGDWELDVIQTDAAINPGNSGGALINSQGELIGINSLKIANSGVEGLGFAIPSNDVKTIIKQLQENGQVERAYLGVGLQDVRTIPSFYMPSLPEKVDAGAIIVSIDDQSAAAKAGLKVEDIIVKMNDKKIESDKDVRKFLYKEAEIGEDITLTIYRDGKQKEIDVTLTSNLQEQIS